MTWLSTGFGEKIRAAKIDKFSVCEMCDEYWISSNKGFLARDADKRVIRFVFDALATAISDETPGVFNVPDELERARQALAKGENS